MNQGEKVKDPSTQDVKQRRSELQAALRKEKRISRRQVLLKKLWKLEQREAEKKEERDAATSAG
jgi:hypothetical protein